MRLQQVGVLVVYDPEQRYLGLCLSLNGDKCQVIVAGESSIESRAAALRALQELGRPNPPFSELLIYVPAKAPLTDEEKMLDPFAIYGACGAVFPEGDGDEYLSICRKAKPDYDTEIRRIFKDNPNPGFAVIDAVGGGAGWPSLQSLLKADSARDLLFSLLAPSDAQKDALKAENTWINEAKTLFMAALGLKLVTKIKAWPGISDELWRFLLFSEFAFDLPVPLPAGLSDVPRAPAEARFIVEELCDQLRNDRRTRALYIQRAEMIEAEFNLPAACQAIENLGVRETFPFEERSVFHQAVQALKRGSFETLNAVMARRSQSVWTGRGETEVQWQLIESAAQLVQACEEAGERLPNHSRSQATLIDFYLSDLREVDRMQREFEEAASEAVSLSGEPAAVIGEAAVQARKVYRQLVDKVQVLFIKHLEKEGWPPSGRLANTSVFDKLVAPKLQESGHRIALLLIDTLRYELGVELARLLHQEDPVETQAAFAQLPTITPVGMASLLPGAGQHLRLARKEDSLAIFYGDQPLNNVTQRMDVLRKFYGQRFAEMPLAEFVRGKKELVGTVDLLVLRSNDMDQQFESDPETAPGLISRTFQQIRGAIYKLRALGFQDAIIATDHGFYLNPSPEPGDACPKPSGNWVAVHERMVLGDGMPDAGSFVLSAGALGLRGDFNQAGGPRALVAYKSGEWYLHGGASLHETIVPVIAVRISAPETKLSKQPAVSLTYKRGGHKITTLLPVIEVRVEGQADLFTGETGVEILIEAQDKQGDTVGEAKPGGPVNPATRTLMVKPGETIQVTLRMSMEYQGPFAVKALDPKTRAALGKSLDLETNYLV